MEGISVKLTSSAMYDETSSMVDAVETVYNVGRFKQSLQNSQFGSSSQIVVPNQSLMSTWMLYLRLPPIAPADNVILPRGWG